eukprot:TRINITY_DN405_c0_g2_i1.p1 TRINITY_DN405_c0_g2~~TRINITY_DN405_c0_g2_i1.p1  ORF type:complete len:650 (-),score=110.45 TRINITY_DN405_c0_g2_i1:424-2373(-)
MSYALAQKDTQQTQLVEQSRRNTSLEQSCSVFTRLGSEEQERAGFNESGIMPGANVFTRLGSEEQERAVFNESEIIPRSKPVNKRSHDSLHQTTSKEFNLMDKSEKEEGGGEGGEEEEEGDEQSYERPLKRVKMERVQEVQDDVMRDQEEIIRPDVPKRCSSHKLQVRDKVSGSYLGSIADGHMKYKLGMSISQRFKIINKMGEGTFGQVFCCWDRIDQDFVALKVIRNVKKYRDAAMTELKVLEAIKQNDRQGKWHCVSLSGWFERRGHVCMVFQKLGPSIFDFLKRNNYRGFPLQLIRSVMKQLLEAVAYMHELKLIHTDLKPENILLINDDYVKEEREEGSGIGKRVPVLDQVKVIDFGSATFDDDYHSTVVQTRHYRAPEVILGLGWTYPCDIWSVGCILYELIVGEALFQTRSNLEHLTMMEKILGKIPEIMVRDCNESARKYFTRNNQLDWPKKSSSAVRRLTSLRKLIRDRGDRSFAPFLNIICDLTERMLRYDPGHRITAKQALKHEFFQMDFLKDKNQDGISIKNTIKKENQNDSYAETDYDDQKIRCEQTLQEEINRSENQTLTPRQIYDDFMQKQQDKQQIKQQQQQQQLQFTDDQLEKENNQVKIADDDVVFQKGVDSVMDLRGDQNLKGKLEDDNQ